MEATLRSIPAVLLLALSSPTACGPPAQIAYEERLEEATPGASHAVYSGRLRELMSALGRLERERLPQAMDVAEERERRVLRVSRVARELAESAGRISEVAPTLGLGSEEQLAFDRYAEDLARRSRELAERAPELGSDGLREARDRIRQVCEDCHSRFRVPWEPSSP